MKKILSAVGFAIALSGTVSAQNTATAKKENKAASVTAAQVIDKYFTALGGKAKLEAVKTLTIENSISVQGMEIVSVSKKMGNKFKSSQNVMGQEMVQVFDGEKGYVTQMGNRTEFPAEQINEMKKGLTMEALAYTPGNFKPVTTEQADNKTYYVLESEKGKFYFDAATGLLYKANTAQGEANIKSYMTVDGIKFPELIEANGGGQQVSIKTTKVVLNAPMTAEDFK